MESLNPLVTVEALPAAVKLEGHTLDSLVKDVDMVCVTDLDRESVVRNTNVYSVRCQSDTSADSRERCVSAGR